MTARLALVVMLTGLFATPAAAQSAQGALASVEVAAATGIGSGGSGSIAGGVAYRLNRVFGLGVELTWIPSFESKFPLGPSGVSVPAADFGSPFTIMFAEPSPVRSRALIFTTNVRLEVPTTSPRIIPYVVAGGGTAAIRERFVETIPAGEVPGLPGLVLPAVAYPLTQSFTNLALTLGGGVSVHAAEHISVDVDLRYLYLTGSHDFSIGRFGAGISYRF